MLDCQKVEDSLSSQPSLNLYSQMSEERKFASLSDQSKEPVKKQSSLHVAIRCRPLLKHEIKANHYEILRIMDKKVILLLTLACYTP